MPQFDSAAGDHTDIAIVGMAGRFPGARDLDTFWELVVSGKNGFRRLTDDDLKVAGVPAELRGDPNYVPVTGAMDDIEGFDAEFFEIGPRDAALMDPQHRHFLEVCWEALEDAGHVPSRFPGSIGVYAGSGMNGYLVHNLLPNRELVDPLGFFAVRHTSNDKDFLSTGVSYRLNLKGPSVNVQTACSTSLVAIHLAAQALLAGECDMALAGGVTIEVPHGQGYLYREGEILARDGVCRAFDAASSGTVLTSGAGVVALRRLSDAQADGDHIYAVVKATAINNDGSGKVGYLAPSVDGHAAIVAEAQELAGVAADSIQYVEAHGTGTPVGDPIEVAALTQAFRRSTSRSGFARIGSTKPTIGHLDTAAGVASVIKTALALSNQTLPPIANFTAENPLLELSTTPFTLSRERAAWPRLDTPRRAGVSSLGVGGTNAHAILEEAPERSGAGHSETGQFTMLPLSAKSATALARAAERLADHLERHPELRLDDVAFTLQEGREEFAFRQAISASSREQAVERLRALAAPARATATPSVVFMFPGGGAQYPNMGRELYNSESIYRETADRCLQALDPALRSAVRELLFPEPGHEESAAEQLTMPSVQLPAILLTELSLAQLFISWGVRPDAMTGHSLGEYAAACIAGVFSPEDAMRIVALRGRIMERFDDAAMLSVALSEPVLTPLLSPGVSLAAVNAPELCLVSGATGPIRALETRLVARDVPSRRLRFKGAVHCSLLDPHLDEFRSFMERVHLSAPAIPYISNVTGDWVTPQQAQTVDYWVRHLRYTVRFADGLATLLQDPNRVLIEVGPGNTLTTLSKQQPTRPLVATQALPHPSEALGADDTARAAVGRIWAAGARVDWQRLRGPRSHRRVSLPPYQFERTHHWYAPVHAQGRSELEVAPPEEWPFQPTWRRSDLIGSAERIVRDDAWVIVGPRKATGDLARQFRILGADVVRVDTSAAAYERCSAWEYRVRTASEADWDTVLGELANFRQSVAGVVWIAPVHSEHEDAAFYGPVAMLKALAQAGHRARSFTVVTKGVYSVDGENAPAPLGALAEGPIRVAPAEFDGLQARLIDVDSAAIRRNLAAIVAEAQSGTDPIVALRHGRRWVRGIDAMQLPTRDTGPIGTSILVTGGLGGLGLSLARRLAERTAGMSITLVSRQALPPREGWPALSETTGNALAEITRSILEIESLGASVLVVNADASDEHELRTAFVRATDQFGHIDTVIHAAGVLDDVPISLRDRRDSAEVLRPKVAGTNALLRAAAANNVTAVVLCSSLSTELGLPGQVDYVAANAYLNAIAAAGAATGMRVVSVPFGRWDEVGLASGRRDVSDGLGFIGKLVRGGADARFRSTKLPRACWVFDGHRLPSGISIMPGTGFLQAFISAARKASGATPVALAGVQFLEALAARDGHTVNFSTEILDGTISVRSKQSTHALAQLAEVAPGSGTAAQFDWTRQPLDAPAMPSFQADRLIFGKRWDVLRGIERAGDQTFATIALNPEFQDDLVEYDLHPALLDIALSCGISDSFLSEGSIVAPVTCDLFEVHAPLPACARVVARRVSSSDPQEQRFDVDILDGSGRALVARASGITYRRLAADSVERISVSAAADRPLVPYGCGLNPAQAWPLFERIVATQAKVAGLSSVPVHELLKRAARRGDGTAPQALLPRPTLSTEMEVPRDAVESSLATMWSECLGVATIGVHDQFFDLGGHSLIGLRLISRIQAAYGVKLTLANIQERPTVALQAELLRGSIHLPAGPAESETPTESNLVIFRDEGSKAPFFCVHGMFGNVMNFTDLAKASSGDRPFIAIQQHGLDGTPTPYRTIEAMAEAYLRDVRRYQPHGPYVFGGYSAGGCIAIEMARQVIASGETVDRVVMLDSWGPAMVGRDFSLRFSRMLRRLRFEGPKLVSRKIRFTLNQLRPKATNQVALRNAPGEQKVFANVELGNVVVEALHNYRFAGVDAPVTLVAAAQREPETRFLPHDLGWGKFLPQLDVADVQAPHITMCTGTNARLVASAIEHALDR